MNHIKNSTVYDVYENPIAERVNGIIKNEYLIPYGVDSFERFQKLILFTTMLDRMGRNVGQCLTGKVMRFTCCRNGGLAVTQSHILFDLAPRRLAFASEHRVPRKRFSLLMEAQNAL
ncbi:hypothetical protein [Leptospira alstonii]